MSTSTGILSIGGFNYEQRDLDSVLILPTNDTAWRNLPPISIPRFSLLFMINKLLLIP